LSWLNPWIPELGSGRRSAESAILKTEANIKWMKQHYNDIVDWLQRKNQEKAL
jgi:hypothetical protein